MMNKMMRILGVLAFALVGAVAQAQSTYPVATNDVDNALGTMSPYRGTYYDAKQPGTGIQVDVSANGSAFVTYYSYANTGNPAWYIVQGTYVPSDEATRWKTGVIGTLTGQPFYQAMHGQCLGCPYQPTTGAQATSFMPNLTWVNSREVKMTVGSQSWDFTAPNLDTGTDASIFGATGGTWAVAYSLYFTGLPAQDVTTLAYNETLQLTPATYPVVLATNVGQTAFSSTAKAYTASCSINTAQGFNQYCLFFSGWFANAFSGNNQDIQPTGVPIFWYDPVTNRFALDMATLETTKTGTAYVIGKQNLHADLYLEGANALEGRGMTQGAPPSYAASYVEDGGLVVALSMVKLPANLTVQ